MIDSASCQYRTKIFFFISVAFIFLWVLGISPELNYPNSSDSLLAYASNDNDDEDDGNYPWDEDDTHYGGGEKYGNSNYNSQNFNSNNNGQLYNSNNGGGDDSDPDDDDGDEDSDDEDGDEDNDNGGGGGNGGGSIIPELPSGLFGILCMLMGGLLLWFRRFYHRK